MSSPLTYEFVRPDTSFAPYERLAQSELVQWEERKGNVADSSYAMQSHASLTVLVNADTPSRDVLKGRVDGTMTLIDRRSKNMFRLTCSLEHMHMPVNRSFTPIIIRQLGDRIETCRSGTDLHRGFPSCWTDRAVRSMFVTAPVSIHHQRFHGVLPVLACVIDSISSRDQLSSLTVDYPLRSVSNLQCQSWIISSCGRLTVFTQGPCTIPRLTTTVDQWENLPNRG